MSLEKIIGEIIRRYVEDVEVENTGEKELIITLTFKNSSERNLAYKFIKGQLTKILEG